VPVGVRPEIGGIPGVTRPVRIDDPGTWWQADAAEGLVIPLGTYSLDDVLPMWLGEGGRHHVMVAGMTGSGKSTLLHDDRGRDRRLRAVGARALSDRPQAGRRVPGLRRPRAA